VNILCAKDEALAKRFATRGAPKFVGDDFIAGPFGLPLVRTAVAALVCKKFAHYDCGDHSVIVGEVDNISAAATGEAMVYYRREFRDFALSIAAGEDQS
jgi:flavin reductase ActVB